MHGCRRRPDQGKFAYRIDESDGFYRMDAYLDDDYCGVPGLALRFRTKNTFKNKTMLPTVENEWISYGIAKFCQMKGKVVIDMVPNKLMHDTSMHTLNEGPQDDPELIY